MTLWGEGKTESGKRKSKKIKGKSRQVLEGREDDSGHMEFSRGGSGDDMDEIYDNDLRNAEVVYDSHSTDPIEVMRLLKYDDSPMAKGDEEVVIKVEVSNNDQTCVSIMNN